MAIFFCDQFLLTYTITIEYCNQLFKNKKHYLFLSILLKKFLIIHICLQYIVNNMTSKNITMGGFVMVTTTKQKFIKKTFQAPNLLKFTLPHHEIEFVFFK